MVLNVHRNRTAYQGRDRVLSRSKALYRYIATPKHFPGKLNMTPVYGDSVLSCLLVCVFISSLLFVRVDCVYRYERDDLLCIFSTMNCEYQPKRLCDPKELSAEPQWLTSHSHRCTHADGAYVQAHWSSFVAATSDFPSFVYSSPTSAHSETKLMNSSSSSNLTETSKTALCFVSQKRDLTRNVT